MRVSQEERENRLKYKEKEVLFINEIKEIDYSWFRSRRVEFLFSEINYLDKKLIEFNKIKDLCNGEIYQWFSDYIENDICGKIKKDILKYKSELNFINSDIVDDKTLTREDIYRAKEISCCEFLEIAREENNRAWARCVFHEEKTPSFCVYKDSNSWYCFSCCKGGDNISLVGGIFNLNFIDSVKYILKK